MRAAASDSMRKPKSLAMSLLKRVWLHSQQDVWTRASPALEPHQCHTSAFVNACQILSKQPIGASRPSSTPQHRKKQPHEINAPCPILASSHSFLRLWMLAAICSAHCLDNSAMSTQSHICFSARRSVSASFSYCAVQQPSSTQNQLSCSIIFSCIASISSWPGTMY